jgi:TP901 family phage tail tape measure protein
MAINVKIDPDIQHLIKGFEKGAKQFNSKSASKTKLKFAIDEKSFSRPLGKITGQVNMFESAMEAANARVIAFGASTAVLATVVKSLKDLVNVSIEVEAAFADINRILNLSGGNLDKFSNKLFDTAQKTASTFQAASSAALEFSRQGLKTEEVLKRTSDALTLVRLTGMNAKKSVDLLTATVNAFTDLDTTSAVDKFVAVETKFAVAARDLVEGLSRVGSAAVDAKVDFNELNALITAVQQTTGRGGAVIGNALKTIFTRLQRESTLEALERFNVTVRDVQGNILPATQVLDNFAGKYDKLADSTQAYLREQVAGVFQANILSAILKDLNKEQSTFSRALDVSVNATENAAQANEKLNQTMSALLQNTATEFAKLQKNLGDAAFLDLGKGIVGAMQTALKSLNSALDKDSTGAGAFFAQGFVSGLSNVLQGPVLIGALQIILKVAKQSFTFLAQAVPTLLNITTQAQKRAQTEEFINNLLRSDVDLAKQIVSAEGNQSRQLELVLAKSRAITEQYQAQYRLSTSLGGAIVSGGSFITASGVKGSTASKIKNKAGGYTPSINAEQSAINRGVGGAGSGAYPVVIPNFAFGGGNVGPVVANSSEVMVPNYGGSGGSAIFNQQMISQYGMPNGAVPIASKGLVSKNKKVGRQFEKDVGNAIGVNPSYNSPIDFSSVIRKPVSKGFGPHLYRKNAIADAHSGLGHTASQIISKLLNELHQKPESNIKLGWDDAKNTFVLDSGFIEIIGAGKDRRGVTRKSNFSSLGSRAKKRYSDLEGQDFFTKFNQDYVSLSSGYIPNFAAGRGTLSSTADPLSLKAAQAENPFINSLDTGKLGFDRHEKLNIRLTNKKGGDKKGGGNINREFGNNAEKKAAPIVKKMGYFPAHKAGMFNAEHSAVDFIKTSNGLPKGGALTGVMELKAGGIKPETISKPLRAITENLHLPIVQNMFKKEGPENLKYDSILATRKIGPDPYKMTGMMRKGMGKGANMARGYVPNFAKGEIFGVSAMTSGKKMGKGKAGRAQAQFEKIAQSMSQAGLYGDAILNVLRNTAKSLNLTGETIKKLEPKFKSLSNNASKGNMASYVLGNNLQQTAKESKKQKTLMQRMSKQLQRPGVSMGLMFGAPMLAGLAEQGITGGKSRLDQSDMQRFAGSAVSNVTSFAASGAMIAGPYGAFVGGLIGLGKAAMDTSLSLEELKEKAENYDKTTEEVTSSADRYIKAQEDMASALSKKDYFDAQDRATKAFEELTSSGSNLDQAFLSAGGNIAQLADNLKRYEQERAIFSDIQRATVRAEEYSPSFIDPSTKTEKEISRGRLERAQIRIKEELQNMNASYSDEQVANMRSEITDRVMSDLGLTANLKLGSRGKEKATAQFGFMAQEYLPNITLLQQEQLDIAAADQGPKAVAEKMIEFSDKLNTEHMPMLLEFFTSLGPSMKTIVSLFQYMSQRIKAETDLTPQQKAFFENFTRIKDSIKQSVKEIGLTMQKRNLEKEFADSMRKLQDSILDGIKAPMLKFERSKSKTEADFTYKIENERDQFFKDNAAKYADLFGGTGHSQEGLRILTNFQKALRAGDDTSEFEDQMRELFDDQLTPAQSDFFEEMGNLDQSYSNMIQGQENQRAINKETLRIEEIRARNTQAELDAQYEIRNAI